MEHGDNPMTFKKNLAFELTKQLNSKDAAHAAQGEFETRFQKGNLAQSSLPTVSLTTLSSLASLSTIILEVGIAESKSKAKQLIDQHAVKINDTLVTNETLSSEVKTGDIIHAGKKAIKLV